MADWADEIAGNLLGVFHDEVDEIAAALRKAKADGMREAADSIIRHIEKADFDDLLTARDAHSLAHTRAAEIEKGNA